MAWIKRFFKVFGLTVFIGTLIVIMSSYPSYKGISFAVFSAFIISLSFGLINAIVIASVPNIKLSWNIVDQPIYLVAEIVLLFLSFWALDTFFLFLRSYYRIRSEAEGIFTYVFFSYGFTMLCSFLLTFFVLFIVLHRYRKFSAA